MVDSKKSLFRPFALIIKLWNIRYYNIWQMHNLLELIKKEQNIYNTVFHEVIRQVRAANDHKTSMLL